MFNLCSDVGIGGIDQIMEPHFWRVRQDPELSGTHCHSKPHCSTCHLERFSDTLATRIAAKGFFINMEQLGGRGELMHLGGRGLDRADQTEGLIDAEAEFNPQIPLLPFLS